MTLLLVPRPTHRHARGLFSSTRMHSRRRCFTTSRCADSHACRSATKCVSTATRSMSSSVYSTVYSTATSAGAPRPSRSLLLGGRMTTRAQKTRTRFAAVSTKSSHYRSSPEEETRPHLKWCSQCCDTFYNSSCVPVAATSMMVWCVRNLKNKLVDDQGID